MFQLKVYTEVKPVRARVDEWIVFRGNILECLQDDVRRYGWRVALYNIKVMLFGGPPKAAD